MKKKFNITGLCIPEYHYMVDISAKVDFIIQKYINENVYFTINRARQYGKTTTLDMLYNRLKNDYIVILISFEGKEEYFYSRKTMANGIFRSFRRALSRESNELADIFKEKADEEFPVTDLSERIGVLCEKADKEIILMIDEVDKAADNDAFLSFLGMLRDRYIERQRGRELSFKNVILAGVHDIKNLKSKIRPDENQKYNSPWNITENFELDMSFSIDEISEMLDVYRLDNNVDIDVQGVAELIYDYTSGYPFFVSYICKIIDESELEWSKQGIKTAVKIILNEKNTLFDDISKKISDYPKLRDMLHDILFNGQKYLYSPDDEQIQLGIMFGLICHRNGEIFISNRIFETRLYNQFILEETSQNKKISDFVLDNNQFILNGYIDMDKVMEKFSEYFAEIYLVSDKTFIEENGRKLFLLFLKPIINGTGNYYIESRTRDMRRTDIIVDYHGKQYIIEMKIWRGEEYNKKGQQQLAEYLEYYKLEKGYLLSFNFNKNKKTGITHNICNGKEIIEIIV